MGKESEIKEYLECLISELLKGRNDGAGMPEESALLGEMGFDSIAFVNFLVSVEEKYDVELDEEYSVILQSYTLGDLIGYLATGEKKKTEE